MEKRLEKNLLASIFVVTASTLAIVSASTVRADDLNSSPANTTVAVSSQTSSDNFSKGKGTQATLNTIKVANSDDKNIDLDTSETKDKSYDSGVTSNSDSVNSSNNAQTTSLFSNNNNTGDQDTPAVTENSDLNLANETEKDTSSSNDSTNVVNNSSQNTTTTNINLDKQDLSLLYGPAKAGSIEYKVWIHCYDENTMSELNYDNTASFDFDEKKVTNVTSFTGSVKVDHYDGDSFTISSPYGYSFDKHYTTVMCPERTPGAFTFNDDGTVTFNFTKAIDQKKSLYRSNNDVYQLYLLKEGDEENNIVPDIDNHYETLFTFFDDTTGKFVEKYSLPNWDKSNLRNVYRVVAPRGYKFNTSYPGEYGPEIEKSYVVTDTKDPEHVGYMYLSNYYFLNNYNLSGKNFTVFRLWILPDKTWEGEDKDYKQIAGFEGEQHGQKCLDGKWYLFDNNGNIQTGLQNLTSYGQNKICYYEPNGSSLTFGQMQYSEQKINGKWYYFDKVSGAMKTGFVNLGNKTVYYGSDGAMRYGEQNIDGKWYLFNKSTGAMQTGYQDLSAYGNNKIFLYGSDGSMLYGEQNVDGYWLLFDKSSGAMLYGFQKMDDYGKNYTCYYNKWGRKVFGEQEINGKWYYFDKVSGAMQTGFVKLGNKTVYYGPDGAMRYGEQNIDGKWYLFNKSTGAMQTGYQDLSAYGHNKVCLYGSDGVMLYGEQNVDGYWLLFDQSSGAMLYGFQKMDDYGKNYTCYYNKWGRKVFGEQEINGKWYYFDKDSGAMQTGFVNLGNKTVYYGPDGAMCYGKVVIDGKLYTFNTVTGALVSISPLP